MSGREWIHCNKCYTRFIKDSKFYLTGCGHLNCQRCVLKFESNGKKCILCNTSTRAVLLSNELSRDVLSYFEPLDESVDRLKNIIKFQTKNMSALLIHMINKYNYAKNEVMKSYKTINDLKKDISRLKSLLKNHPMGGSAGGLGMGDSASIGFNTSSPMSNKTITSSPFIGNNSLISSVLSPAAAIQRNLQGSRPYSTQYLNPHNNIRRY